MTLWVIFDRDKASSRSRHVGCGPESGSKNQDIVICREGRGAAETSLAYHPIPFAIASAMRRAKALGSGIGSPSKIRA